MDNGQLISHVDTDLVTREQLALIPAPDATASWRPIPHIELIETLEKVLRANQIAISQEQFALRRDGSTLFGVLQLNYNDTNDGGAAMGIRTSNDKSNAMRSPRKTRLSHTNTERPVQICSDIGSPHRECRSVLGSE